MSAHNGRYVLDGHTPVPEPNVLAWAKWLEKSDARRVARTKLPSGVSVSTVFLGLDHRIGAGPPLLFETMVFGGPLDGEEDRYSTWEQAEAGHAAMVAKAEACP